MGEICTNVTIGGGGLKILRMGQRGLHLGEIPAPGWLREALQSKSEETWDLVHNDIIVYFAMFSTILDKMLCFLVLKRWKWVIIFQSLITSGTWDFFYFSPLILKYSQLELGTFKFFDDPLFGLIPKFRCFFDWKASQIKLYWKYTALFQLKKQITKSQYFFFFNV